MNKKVLSLLSVAIFGTVAMVPVSPVVAKDLNRIKCVREFSTPTLEIVGTPSVEKGVTVKGSGWCSDYDNGGSGAAIVVIKLNKGAVEHVDTSINENKGVWFMISDADPKTGSFEKTIPLPDGAEKGFTATPSKFDVKNFSVTALSGSSGEHDLVGSVTKQYQDVFTPTSENISPSVSTLEAAFSKLGDVFLSLDGDHKSLKVFIPDAEPGDFVWVYPLVPRPNFGLNEDLLPDFDKAFYWDCQHSTTGYSSAWRDSDRQRELYWKVGDDRSITLPLYLHDGKKRPDGSLEQMQTPLSYGPVLLPFFRVRPGDGAITKEGTTVGNKYLGAAWVTNLGYGAQGDVYPSDPAGPDSTPNIVVGLRPDLLPEHWEEKMVSLDWGKECSYHNPNDGGLSATVAATPSVNVNREITVPDLPTVHYSIDGKDVSGSVAIDDDSEHDVVVKAVAADGYRLVGADDKGVVEFTVHVPKKVVPVTETPAPVTMIIAPDPVTSTVTPAPVTTTWSAEPVTETTTSAVTTTVERTVEPTKDGAGSSESSDGNFGSGVLTGVGAITAVVAVLFAVLSSSGLIPSLFPANTPVVVKR